MDDDAHASRRRRPRSTDDRRPRSTDDRSRAREARSSRETSPSSSAVRRPPRAREREIKHKKTPASHILTKKSRIVAHTRVGRRAREVAPVRRDARGPPPNARAHSNEHGMVAADVTAGARTSLESSDAPRRAEEIEGFDRARPRRSDSVALIDARELSAREQMVAVERAKLLRERVVACYRTEGVNHLEKCKGHVKAYLASVKNVGTHAINAGEHDR